MDMASSASKTSIVIKVNYGGALRRFIASINEKKLVLDIGMLRDKVCSLFSIGSGVEFSMTYVDEDGDVVILADDDDLHDIVGQSLNPLRIIVKLDNSNPSGSSGTFAPWKLSQSQLPHEVLNPVVSETQKSPLIQPPHQTWNPFVSKTQTSPLVNPAHFQTCNHVFSKTPTSPLAKPQFNPWNPVVSKTPLLPLIKPDQFKTSSQVVSGTPKSPLVQSQFQTWNTVVSHTPMSTLLQPHSQTFNTATTFSASGVDKPLENMKVAHLNQIPSFVTGMNAQPPTSGASNVDGQSSTTKSKESVNLDIGSISINLIDKLTPKVGEGADHNVSYFQFQPVKAPINAIKSVEGSTGKNNETTEGVKESRIVEVNPEVGSTPHICVSCNNCGTHPIMRPWVKSKVKKYYDLCCFCFANLQGSFADYIRMDHPATGFSHHTPASKGFHDFNLGETSVYLNLPDVVRNLKGVEKDNTMNNVLPGNSCIKDRETLPVKDSLIVDNDDVLSTMTTVSTTTEPSEPVAHLDSSLATRDVLSTKDSLIVDNDDVSTTMTIVGSAPSTVVEMGQELGSGTQIRSDEHEEALFRELEEKGFKQLDFNKQMLRRNDYDLEKRLDDLCGVSDWDPMLDELQEMGFGENETGGY